MADCGVNVIGVKIVYCLEGEEAPKELWVNLKTVSAIAWSDTEVGHKASGKPSKDRPIPTDPNGPPSSCPRPEVAADAPLCWWTGSEWVCGDE